MSGHRLFWGGWFHTYDVEEVWRLTEARRSHVIASVAYILDWRSGTDRMQFCLRPRTSKDWQ